MIKCLFAACLFACTSALAESYSDQSKLSKQTSRGDTLRCILVSVTDGDSILVRCQQTSERVRFIGIDAPELHSGEHSQRQSDQYGQSEYAVRQSGKAAKAHLASILEIGQSLELRLDREARDRYGRLLAYVYSDDGSMINSRMVADGYAAPLTVKPNVVHKEEFEQLYSRARREQRGIWGSAQ